MTSKTSVSTPRLKLAKLEKIREIAAHRSSEKISEKITINMGYVDLGQVDLLVSEGFYGNRTDFIRTAIRNQIGTHADAVKQVVARKTLVLGLQHFSSAELQLVKKDGHKLAIRVLGLATIADDVTAALALATIESVEVLGALHTSQAVKNALAGRIR